jgi:hypothetical protein
MRVDGWDGRAYDDFFLEVIRRFVGQAWFIDGWEYSHGATKEYILCTELGLERIDEGGDVLPPRAAAVHVAAAVDHLSGLGVDHAKLRSRLILMDRLVERRGTADHRPS